MYQPLTFQKSQPNSDSDLTLVCIHGATLSAAIWQDQISGLGNRFQVIAPDLPGHGNSPGQGYDTISAYADSILGFVREKHIENPVFCGISMGGAIVLDLLIRGVPSAGGILINTGARLRVMEAIFDIIRNDFSAFPDRLSELALSPSADRETLAPLVRSVVSCTAETARRDFTACNRFDVRNHLSAIRTPVLVLGAEDDTTTPPRYAVYLKDHIPGAILEMVNGAGHLSPIETPEALNTAISNFMASLAQKTV